MYALQGTSARGVQHGEVERRTDDAGSAGEDYSKYTLRLGRRWRAVAILKIQ